MQIFKETFRVQNPGMSRIFWYVGRWFVVKNKNTLLDFASTLQALSKLLNHQCFSTMKFEYFSYVITLRSMNTRSNIGYRH